MSLEEIYIGESKELDQYRKFSFCMIVVAEFFTITALYGDAWWHAAVGRESLWIPPHIAMFAGLASVFVAFLIRLVVDYKTGKSLPIGYRYLITGIILIALSIPIDDLWHRTFGIEFGYSVLVLWSPPHLFGVGSGILAALGVLHTLVRESNPSKNRLFAVFTTIQFALVTSLVMLIVLPFEPTSVLRVLSIYGAPFVIFPFMLFRLWAFDIVRRVGVFTLMAAVNWIHLGILLSFRWGFLIFLPFAVGVLPGVLVDMIVYLRRNLDYKKGTMIILSAFYAFSFSIIFYPTANAYRNLGYSISEIGVIVLLATIAAALAGNFGPIFSDIFAKGRQR